jgi:hypothetical protein
LALAWGYYSWGITGLRDRRGYRKNLSICLGKDWKKTETTSEDAEEQFDLAQDITGKCSKIANFDSSKNFKRK